MRRRYIQLFAGTALIIAGAVTWLRPSPSGIFFPVAFGLAGTACLARYLMKRENWALVGWVMLLYMALAGVLMDRPAFLGCFTAPFTASAFFVLPGGVGLTLGLTRRRDTVILPAVAAIWLGFFIFARDLRVFSRNSASLFCGCMACAGISVWAAARRLYGWKPLMAAAVFAAAAALLSDGFRHTPFVTRYLPGLFSFIAVGAGVALIGLTRKRR